MKKRILIAICLIVVICTSTVLLSACSPSFYSEEQHIKRISKRVQEDFVESGLSSSFEVYPLYDENDKAQFYLVELEPDRYAVIHPVRLTIFNVRMYTLPVSSWNVVPRTWTPYRIREDMGNIIEEDGIFWERKTTISGSKSLYRYEALDRYDDLVCHAASPYKVAGVLNEKKYIFNIKGFYFIPAVKRENKYINLVSMEEFELTEEYRAAAVEGKVPVMYWNFVPKTKRL